MESTGEAVLFEIISADFSAAWEEASPYCQVKSPVAMPLTELEQAAVTAAGYGDPESVDTLYSMCANVDPNNGYITSNVAPNAAQSQEIAGMLTLCPSHPQEPELRAAIERGEVDAELQAAGKLFFAGTFLVGSEVQPGTYAIEGEITDCYWERQDNAGSTIENGFVASARRVEVTIRSSDYAFHSEGCGQWRPAD